MARDLGSIPEEWDIKQMNEVTWVAFADSNLDDIERGDRYELQTDNGIVTVKIVKVAEDRCVLRAASSGHSMFDKVRWSD